MTQVTILHNPRCSKSRQTLQLLRDQNIEPTIIEYLKAPLSKAELAAVFAKLPTDAIIDMMRPKEAEFADAGLDKAELTAEQGLAAMVQFPKLMERPIVIHGDAARIGRPPEAVLEIL